MPNKPAKYGIKFWVACDARSSYAWKMQIYTGRPGRGSGAPGQREKNLSTRVVLDVTDGLSGRNVTCDNFFTSYELGQLLQDRNNTMVGTIRKNKPELPPALLSGTRKRSLFSSRFAFTPDATLVSYLAKRNKNVLLLSTAHAEGRVASERVDKKPEIILDYNRNKGGVDNLDKVIAAYSCRRMTARWPLAVFHNMIDVSCYNSFVLWRELNPDWMPERRNKRRVFLERLGRELVSSHLERRVALPRTGASSAIVSAHRAELRQREPRVPAGNPVSGPPRTENGGRSEEREQRADPDKRKRCQLCPGNKDRKTSTRCFRCGAYICRGCNLGHCRDCARSHRTRLEPDER